MCKAPPLGLCRELVVPGIKTTVRLPSAAGGGRKAGFGLHVYGVLCIYTVTSIINTFIVVSTTSMIYLSRSVKDHYIG